MSTLAELLARDTREGELYETLPDGRLRCYACGHCCPLPNGAIGVCKVRFNQNGKLRASKNGEPSVVLDRRGQATGGRPLDDFGA